MSRSRISRGPRTVLAGIGLIVVYLVYARVTSPLLNVERVETTAPKTSDPQEKSPVFADQAQKWFTRDPWVKDAKAKFRDGGRLLYFNKQQLHNENRSIAISPVAFLWQQEEGEAPITATADSAQLDSSTKFEFQGTKFGKIVSGMLSGDVRITGPDGMLIEGRSFQISEGAMKIWTGQPVSFSWGTHSGRAESGAEIELLASDEAASSGLRAVTDVQRVRLLGRVHCNLMFHDKKARREPVQMTVNAANGFEFFVPTNQATFSGFVDREANLDNQVLVERPSASGSLERLFCSKLVLHFQPKIQNIAKGKSSNQLKLDRITAEGQPVEFWSMKDGQEQVYASMGLLKYYLERSTLELQDRTSSVTGERFSVDVHREGTKLTCGNLQLEMDDKNDLHTILCRGEGRIGPSARGAVRLSERVLGATWQKSMTVRRGEEQRITLQGAAKVVQASLQPSGKLQPDLSLTSEIIDLLLDAPTQQESVANQTDEATSSPMQSLKFSGIRPKQLVAQGNVVMVTPDVHGTARDKLLINFVHLPAVGPGNGVNATPVKPVSQSAEKESTQLTGKTTFTTDTVEAVVRLIESSPPQFQDVWLKGAVEIDHQSTEKGSDGKQNFTASGNFLFAKGGFLDNTEISLFGDPATVVNSDNRIEGQRIDLTEMRVLAQPVKRQARVEGSGRIRFVVNTGLDGKSLAKPSPLDIYWGEHMSFSGRTADFVGNVRAVMNNETDHDVVLTCAGLKVHFTEDVSLENSGKGNEFKVAEQEDSKSPVGNIERIECESRVVVDIEIMENGVTRGRHHAEFSDLQFNQITGEFHASGPGLIESVQPDKGKQKLAVSNRTVARANTPVKASEPGFHYIRADFIGELNGNRDKKFIHLKQHVRGLFGPVRLLTDRLNIDGLSTEELPENTGAMHCENLSISVIPGMTATENSSFSMVAESNSTGRGKGTRSPCQFESRLFAGVADKIKYDHSKQQFILLAEEGGQATVSHYPDGEKRQVLSGGRFEYYSEQNYLKANQITGVQSTGDLSLD